MSNILRGFNPITGHPYHHVRIIQWPTFDSQHKGNIFSGTLSVFSTLFANQKNSALSIDVCETIVTEITNKYKSIVLEREAKTPHQPLIDIRELQSKNIYALMSLIFLAIAQLCINIFSYYNNQEFKAINCLAIVIFTVYNRLYPQKSIQSYKPILMMLDTQMAGALTELKLVTSTSSDDNSTQKQLTKQYIKTRQETQHSTWHQAIQIIDGSSKAQTTFASILIAAQAIGLACEYGLSANILTLTAICLYMLARLKGCEIPNYTATELVCDLFKHREKTFNGLRESDPTLPSDNLLTYSS